MPQLENVSKIISEWCQGFSMDAYPIEWLDGGELLVEFSDYK